MKKFDDAKCLKREQATKPPRDAPLKVCRQCYAFTYNGKKQCDECGTFFYLSKKDKGD